MRLIEELPAGAISAIERSGRSGLRSPSGCRGWLAMAYDREFVMVETAKPGTEPTRNPSLTGTLSPAD